MRRVFDTNILIDYLHGNAAATVALDASDDPFISRITWIETLVGARDADEETAIHRSLDRFSIHELTPAIAERAAAVRRERRWKLPDAIIYATAVELGVKLVTRNTKDFPLNDPVIHVPYQLPPPRPD